MAKCRCGPKDCVETCAEICGRLSDDLAAKLSPRLQQEWTRGRRVWRPDPVYGAMPLPNGVDPHARAAGRGSYN